MTFHQSQERSAKPNRRSIGPAFLTTFLTCGVMAIVGCEQVSEESTADPAESEQSANGEQVPSQAPPVLPELFPLDFELTDVMTGDALAKSNFEGQVLIVDIWGTWCPPCRREIPHFVALLTKYREQGLAMVGVNFERTAPEMAATRVQQFIEQSGLPYPCALGSKQFIDQVPDMRGYPTTLLIDRSGRVVKKLVGYHSFEELEQEVLPLL